MKAREDIEMAQYKILDNQLVQYSINQADGAYVNGSIVEKTNSEKGDTHQDGDRGIILGSVGPIDKAPYPYGYFILFYGSEKPMFIVGMRVDIVEQPKKSKGVLTIEQFKMLAFDYVFARGILQDCHDDVPIEKTGKMLHWVATKGDVQDWSIYVQSPYWDEEVSESEVGKETFEIVKSEIRQYKQMPFLKTELTGGKLKNIESIKKLVPCDDECLALYRM